MDLKPEHHLGNPICCAPAQSNDIFFNSGAGKRHHKIEHEHNKRVAQAMSRLYMIVEGARKISKILMDDPLW